ncbi:hypothetical protein EON64_04205 [archaeon]|nr:MAG: hypothetical protein EON64_04205 [archaeon]
MESIAHGGHAHSVTDADTFNATVPVTSSSTEFGEVMGIIVFAQKSRVIKQLAPFQDNIDSSETTLESLMIPIVLGISILAMVLVLWVVRGITVPLEKMRTVSLQVIDVMAEDVEARDFSPVINNAGFSIDRTDEVGVLACDFFNVVCVMHNKLVEKRAVPTYPSNPWYLQDDDMEDTSDLTWQKLKGLETIRPLAPTVQAVRKAAAVDDPSNHSAQMSSQRSGGSHKSTSRIFTSKSNTGSRGRKVKPLEADAVMEITPSKKVGWLTCLKTQLTSLGLMFLLAAGASMFITIYLVTTEGKKWSDDSAVVVLNTQQNSLQDIVDVKTIFTESYFMQMSLDVMAVKAAYATVLTGESSRPSWEADGDYFHSYALESQNPYSFDPQGGRYTFSSYFSLVSDPR